MNEQVKLLHFVETRAGLYGLCVDGSVWVYQGQKHGWSKLNMSKMTPKQLKKKQADMVARPEWAD
jgi:hypothetical protein